LANEKRRQTIVELRDCYNEVIRQNSAIDVDQIAELLMRHCLVYYLCNDLPMS
jgi:hypothetical protein